MHLILLRYLWCLRIDPNHHRQHQPQSSSCTILTTPSIRTSACRNNTNYSYSSHISSLSLSLLSHCTTFVNLSLLYAVQHHITSQNSSISTTNSPNLFTTLYHSATEVITTENTITLTRSSYIFTSSIQGVLVFFNNIEHNNFRTGPPKDRAASSYLINRSKSLYFVKVTTRNGWIVIYQVLS